MWIVGKTCHRWDHNNIFDENHVLCRKWDHSNIFLESWVINKTYTQWNFWNGRYEDVKTTSGSRYMGLMSALKVPLSLLKINRGSSSMLSYISFVVLLQGQWAMAMRLPEINYFREGIKKNKWNFPLRWGGKKQHGLKPLDFAYRSF